MNYKNHILVSTALAMPIMVSSGNVSLACLGMLGLGSIMPDIDQNQSYVGKRTRGASDIIGFVFGHRGMTHSLIGLLFVSFIAYTFASYYNQKPLGLFFILGYALHLVADTFSKSGIKWLQPFSKKALKIPLYKTGHLSEYMIGLVMVALVIFEIFYYDLSHVFDLNTIIQPFKNLSF